MVFWRLLKNFVTNPVAWLIVRTEGPVWSFFWQLQIFVAFVLTLAAVPLVVSSWSNLQQEIARVPAGVVLEKKGAELQLTGVTAPWSLADNAVVIDTATTTVRATSTMFFLGNKFLELAPPAQQPQQILWVNVKDFTWRWDEVKDYLGAHSTALVVLFTVGIFLTNFVSIAINSLLLILSGATAAWLVRRYFLRQGAAWRDEFSMSMGLLTGPLIVWLLFSLLGFGAAGVVELILFVLYSVMAGRLVKYARA